MFRWGPIDPSLNGSLPAVNGRHPRVVHSVSRTWHVDVTRRLT